MKRLEREQIVDRARAVLPALVSLGALVVLVMSTSAVTADKPVEEGGLAMTTTQAVHTNHLSRATSPYLLLHAHNPVDWYEWGPEAFARARAENKPIFLSIGYAACHWCHVMAHESFEDPDIAAVLNKSFINIKVDREERPDIDELYMQATLVLNQGQGGWPMSVWLTPDRKPFHAGTYFPPTARWGRPGFMELCAAIGEAWQRRRDEIVTQADKLTSVVRESLKATPGEVAELTGAIVTQTADTLAGAFDAQRGGMLSGGSNKFPPSMALEVMLRAAAQRPSDDPQRKRLVELVERTLDRMATGGIYDQLGGGIHRYSVDPEWHVPHFEKMLYDQALVSRAYVDAYQLTHKPLYARVAREIFDYAMTDLQLSEGGFGSARDADSEGREGEYYVWTRAEVLAALGKADGELFCSFYDVSEAGNWNDPHEPGRPKNILHAPRDLATVAKLNGSAPAESARQLEAARLKLLAVRAQRVPPALDDKVLCEWNGLMIASLARGGCVLGQPKYIAAAARAANFILDKQYQDGRLQCSYRAGRTLETAFLSDYACLIEGLLELYEATFDPHWLKQANELNETLIKHFWDDRDGGFFFTADDHEELVMRRKDVRDGAVPSGNAVQLMNLLRLSVMCGDDHLRALGDQTLTALAAPVRETPWASERFLAAVDFARTGPVEIAIIGNPLKPETRALLKQVYATYLPNRVLMLTNPDQPGDDLHVPLLAGRPLIDGRPAAYICRNFACQRPVTTPDELAAQLSCSTVASKSGIATGR